MVTKIFSILNKFWRYVFLNLKLYTASTNLNKEQIVEFLK